MRLIDADALMREFAEFVRESNNSDFADVPTWNDAVSLLDSAPTIEPEQKHGKWTEKHVKDADWLFHRRFYCSVCGDWQTYGETSYCPNCGARMEESE